MPRDIDALSRTAGSTALDRAALRRLRRLIWPKGETAFRWRLGLTMALLALAALVNALVPMLFARAVDHFTAAPALLAAPFGLLAAYVALQWLARVMNEARWALYGPIEQRVRRRLALQSLEHLHGLSLGFHLARRTGQISRVLDNGLDGMRELLFDSVFLILPLAAEILFVSIILLLRLDVAFAAILFVTLLVYAVCLVAGSEWLRAHQRRAVAEGAIAHGRAIDSLLNYETVKYFNNEEHVALRYDRSLAEVERLTVKALAFRTLTGVVLVTVLGLGMAAILLMAAGRVAAGAMTVGELVLVNAYILQLVRPMDRLGQLYRSIKQAFVDLEQLLRLLDEAPEVADRPDARPLPPGPGEVRFEHVGFGYGPERVILDDIDFHLPAGRTVALVGPTGAGKSTVARLLFRFYDPTSGRILLDGHDLRDLSQASLRAAMAVVPQDAVLFNDTIGYNIAFGRPDATPEEVEEAARIAELHDFIASLPDGYATLVGERGLKLSGGEKQRVAIARAVLKRPRLYILDEATSALDSATEKAIQASLRRISAGTTTLVIAHRLSTIVHADEILVLSEGRLLERGTHTTLLRRNGLYARLWHRQASEGARVEAAE
jgi:ABC-type transport system involved in Fe-S cluster assembly fused permease/ATPase subunit